MKQKIIERLTPFRKKAEAELELAEVNLYNLGGYRKDFTVRG